jgi:hypothetical protein
MSTSAISHRRGHRGSHAAPSTAEAEETRRTLIAAGWSVLLEIDFRHALRDRFDARFHPYHCFNVGVPVGALSGSGEGAGNPPVLLWTVLLYDNGDGTGAAELIDVPPGRPGGGRDLAAATSVMRADGPSPSLDQHARYLAL